jgi:hypothetical protein
MDKMVAWQIATGSAETDERRLESPFEPYTCPYCGGITTYPREAKARLCLRCVRFEGDVHPAMTNARIAVHNARIMGMSNRPEPETD